MLPNINAKNLPTVKAIVESFEGSGVLVTQPKVSLQTNGLNYSRSKDHYQRVI